MREITKRALEKGNWKFAAMLLEREIEGGGLSEEERKLCEYNLIVCYIKLKDPLLAQKFLRRFRGDLSEEEVKELEEEITNLPPKIEDGEIKGLRWYKSNVHLSDVMGLKKVKKKIYEEIISPIQNEKVYKEYGVKVSGGFILYGPPGTGKTLLAKAIAGETKIRMLIANVHELISKYQGESSKNIHTLFEQAREGEPAIIFFDEIDSLATDRNTSNISSTGGEERKIVNTLLTELDGAQKENEALYVIGATNHPWDIDSAFVRSGRFNSFIYVNPPNFWDRVDLFKYYIGKLKAEKIDYTKLALASFGMTPADIENICNRAAKHFLVEMQKKKKFRPLKTADFLWAIKERGEPTLFKEFKLALEKLKEMPPEVQEQYSDMKKDIKFYVKRGKQTYLLSKFLSYFV
ncbi:MAG: ATP-binding protein [Candidatus Micrarchaeia archaeon]